VSISSLTATLPSRTGSLPDLFRRGDSVAPRSDDASAALQTDASSAEERRAPHSMLAQGHEDTARVLARRAALGPLTYGRRSELAESPTAAPVGMRGAYLDVRG
jgi:hypothetical protein